MSSEVEMMVEAAEVFQGAYNHVINNLGETDLAAQARTFTASVVMAEKPYLLVTEEGIARAINLVFTDDRVRDFVFTLAVVFFSRWGTTPQRYVSLVESIAQGVGLAYIPQGSSGGFRTSSTVSVDDFEAMPPEITKRLANTDDARAALLANKWLVVLVLMQLFLSITSEVPKE